VFRRVLRNAGLLLGGRGINGVLGIGYVALAARGLGAAQLGELVLINAFAMLMAELTMFQSWQAVLQYGATALEQGRRDLFQSVIRFGLVLDGLSTVVAVIAGAAGVFLFGDHLGWGREHDNAAALYMLSVMPMVTLTPTGLMRLFDRFGVMARQTALVSALRLAGCALAWALHAPMWGFLLAWASGHVGGFAYLSIHTVRELRARKLLDGFRWFGPLTAELPGAWRFVWSTNINATLEVALTHVATLLVGGLAGPAPAAYWRIGRQVADALAKPAGLLTSALFPELARLRAAGDEPAMWRLARRTGLVTAPLALALLMVSATAGPWLLGAVMGPAFVAAAGVMTWQVGAQVVAILVLPLKPMLIAFGRAASAMVVQLVVGATFLASLPSLVRRFGLEGGGAALVAAELALGAGFMVALRLMPGARRGPAPAVVTPPADDD